MIAMAPPLPKEIRELSTTSGFIAEFYTQCRLHSSDMEAFEFINDAYAQFYGKPRYSDYESFKTIRKRYIKQFANR